MIYYIKLDEDSCTLDINQVKNIHQLSKKIDVSWVEINRWLNGTDRPIEWLAECMIPFPYIKKSGDCYYFSYFKPIIEKRNYKWMSKKVIEELKHMNEFAEIIATSSKGAYNV